MALELKIPRYRGHVGGLRIAQQGHLPDLARDMQARGIVAPTCVTSADGARGRIRNRESDWEIEEDFFGVIEVSRTAMPMLMGAVEGVPWRADHLFSFTALAGTLDGLSHPSVTIVRSFRLDPQWCGRYVQVGQYMVQNRVQQIHHGGQISQIGSQISDATVASIPQRRETPGQLAAQFGRRTRGVDRYSVPFENRRVEVPGGYGFAWSNPIGKYILSDNPTFDPNVGPVLDWVRIAR